MPVFIAITDADISNPAFWAALDISVNSTIDASGISDTIQITMTGNSISFEDTVSGTVTSYSDADLLSGSFSEFVQFGGNNADSDVSGSAGLNGMGYTGGSGNDTFTDDGALGGGLNGGAGDDELTGGTGSNNIDGGDGDDVLRGGGGNNILTGGDGNDTLFAEDGSGNLDGGEGDDVLFAGLNTSFVQGGSGDDTLLLPDGSAFTPFSPTGGNVTLPSGTGFTYLNIANVAIACFTAGALIRTPRGDVAVEDLKTGDLVDTLDNGSQPVRWIGESTVSGRGLHAPIRFLPDSIGNKRSLRLSPQHRVLMADWKCELLFHAREVLCAAKYLCDGDRVFQEPCEEVTYFHVMFDRHEIVFADGALLESFFVGDYITEEGYGCFAELVDIFPELADQGSAMHTARPCLKMYETSLLL